MDFDLKLAVECATAFSISAGIGCVISDAQGHRLYECGYGCASCAMCNIAQQQKEFCDRSQAYGMMEAERFGGKYIYFCPMGLTCFVSPIVGEMGSSARITVGPFLMVERQDYVACDLMDCMGLADHILEDAQKELQRVPVVEPEKVDGLSTLLFMAVGFMNNVSAANRMLDTQGSDAIQGQITSYILQLKQAQDVPLYPFEVERALLRAIGRSEKQEAQRLLNELFGTIFFVLGGDFEEEKACVYELLVLISRTAIDAGADPESTLRLSRDSLKTIHKIENVDELCFWITSVMNSLMDSVFNYVDAKHANAIHKTIQYVRAHCAEKITLNRMADMAYLSPAYFSRVFKKETGQTFSNYLNKVRVEKSKEMLQHNNLRLIDIALMVGFEDQSYFTRVFKRVAGITPMHYREAKGKRA